MNNRVERYIGRLNRLLNFSGICWWIIDLEDDPNIYYCNDYMVDTFSLDERVTCHSVSQTCPIAGDYLKNVSLKSSYQAEMILKEYKQLLNQEIEEYDNRFPYYNEQKNFTYYFHSRAKVLDRDKNDNVSLIYGIIEDVTNEELQRQKLASQKQVFKRLSERDPLTKLYNRRYFMELFKFEFNRALRSQSYLSVLMLDIDHFKLYNDNYGHLAGDNCIQKIAGNIKKALSRKSDIAARYGGEEFIIFNSGTDYDGLNALAKKIGHRIEMSMIPHNFSPTSNIVTVSIGGALGPPKHNTTQLETYIKLADKNLYDAKESGRNQIKVSNI